MGETQIMILLDMPIKYTYKIYLCYDTQKEKEDKFLKPARKAAKGRYDIKLSAPHGIIEDTYRHFVKDYDVYRRYNLFVPSEDISLKNIIFTYQDDDELNCDVKYNNWNIKNIIIET